MCRLINIIRGITVVVLAFYCNFVLADNPPYFPTDVALNSKGQVLITHKGKNSVDVFSENGRTLLHSFTMNSPTGIVVNEDKAYVTTFGTSGHLQILSLESGKVEVSIPTGSGAAFPLLNQDKTKVYVSNQFQNTISEIDIAQKKEIGRAHV